MNRGFADEQVRKSIVFYRGRDADVGEELKDIHRSLRGRHNLNIVKQVRPSSVSCRHIHLSVIVRVTTCIWSYTDLTTPTLPQFHLISCSSSQGVQFMYHHLLQIFHTTFRYV